MKKTGRRSHAQHVVVSRTSGLALIMWSWLLASVSRREEGVGESQQLND